MKSSNKLALAFCFSLSFFFVSCASISGFGKDAKLRFSKKYETVSIDEKLDYLDTKIRYPKFENLPELNKRIENTVMSNWKSFKSYSKKEWNDVTALNSRGNAKLPPFEYLVTFEVSGTRDIISIILNTYIFNGGAHGNTTLTAINYDTSSKAYIDILKASGMTYNQISAECRNQLYKKLIDDNKSKLPPAEKDSIREMINTGAFPQAGNYEIFTVDGAKVIVWFEPYSVTPYSYGIQKVQIKE